MTIVCRKYCCFLTGFEVVPHDGKIQLDIPITINFCSNFSNEEVSNHTNKRPTKLDIFHYFFLAHLLDINLYSHSRFDI